MPSTHVAADGECITTIAFDHGLPWETIWNAPENADLKKARKDPNVLREGDSVFIPDKKPKIVSLATNAVHKVVVKRPQAKLRLRIVVDQGPKPASPPPPGPPSPDRRNHAGEDPAPDTTPRTDEPRKDLAYVFEIDGKTITGATDGDGWIDCPIPPKATKGKLVLAPGTPHETEVQLKLGHLDPIGELSGVKQRLRNLCFDCGTVNDEETPDLEAAVRAFQAKHCLSVTGKADDATRAELLKAHGT
jgi:N-acetylmuramoyl-L-alanine amidase